MTPPADSPGDISQMLQAILFAVGEKILSNIYGKELSLSDLGLIVTTLQKLIGCHIELKPFTRNEDNNTTKIISQDVIDAIQMQLNLL
ncbi:MAG: hypothetical protein LBH08_01345 [Puniceicoccales bacterium]|jgi:hypothetical protein|nr:hypothetical protein [Puniceicoccales bacterium]